MTTEELAAIEKRANERKTAHQIDAVEAMAKSQADVPALVAEVRRLREVVKQAYEEGVADAGGEYQMDWYWWRDSDARKALGEDA